jgi:hypothetical protein
MPIRNYTGDLTMLAPTTKVKNYIDEGLEVWRGDVLCVASYHEASLIQGAYNPDLKTFDVELVPEHYTISYHQGIMPAFNVSKFQTIQELANAMQQISDLRCWKKS